MSKITKHTITVGASKVAHLFKKTKKQIEACFLLGSATFIYILLYGGSRSGKTFILIRAVFLRALRYPESRHLILRFRFQHAKQSLWYDTIPKVIRLCFPGLVRSSADDADFKENKQDWFYQLKNGSQVWLGGLDDKERAEKILGNEYCTIYFNESSQLPWIPVKMAITRLAQNIPGCKKRLFFDCNPPNKRHWIYTLFIKKQDPTTGQGLPNPSKYVYLRMNPDDNVENVGKDYVEDILGSLSERERKRFRDGEFLDDAEGALFRYDHIAKHRIQPDAFDVTKIDEICIALDPAVTSGENSDEHGIIVIGFIRATEDLFVLEDASFQGTPRQWAMKIVELYERWDADMVVGEINNGGDLVEVNLRTISKTIPYKTVRATRGKEVRAEPIANMCERGKLHMVGDFPMLEEELTSWVPDMGLKSPNRLDAMVWGGSYFIKPGKRISCWR